MQYPDQILQKKLKERVFRESIASCTTVDVVLKLLFKACRSDLLSEKNFTYLGFRVLVMLLRNLEA